MLAQKIRKKARESEKVGFSCHISDLMLNFSMKTGPDLGGFMGVRLAGFQASFHLQKLPISFDLSQKSAGCWPRGGEARRPSGAPASGRLGVWFGEAFLKQPLEKKMRAGRELFKRTLLSPTMH